ncbi:2-dehydropantoate 2-reductase [Candidatus Chlorohelix sp.]|uniref:ketopantoate reductase family protein n=1 Tax=Candidatus Chlorohelix sp. TaxID=3139201 RepID=UPI003030D8A7
MRFAIFGTGAVGGYVGGLLALNNHKVSFIARGAHLEAIREKGLTLRYINQGEVKSDVLKVFATNDPEEVGEVDYIIFGVKAYDTIEAGNKLQPLMGHETAIITIQNGLDAPHQLSILYGDDSVVAGAVRVEATLGEPGVVIKYGPARDSSAFEVAELSEVRTTRMEKFVELLNAAHIKASLSADPHTVLWTKFLALAPTAALTAAARAHGGEVFGFDLTKQLYATLVAEAAAVAHAEGVHFAPEMIERAKHPLFPLDTAFKSSLQRDFEKGHRTEVDSLLGALVKRAHKYNVPVPHFETLYALLSLSAKVGYRYSA